jgi:hypothetical protein
MSKENDILIRVRNFMKYWHPEIPRQLPEPARVEYNALHAAIDAHLAPAEKPVAKKAAKKKAAKKVSKKK